MEISGDVGMRTGGRRSVETQYLKMSAEHDGVWEMKFDLRSLLGTSKI